MLKILENNYTFDYDELCECSVVTWHGHSSEEELYEINELFLEFVKANKATKMVQDVLIMSATSAEYKKWLTGNYIPRLYAAGVRYAAIVLPVRPIVSFELEDIVSRVALKEIHLKYFTTTAAAKEWLHSVV